MSSEYLDISIISVSTVAGIVLDLFRDRDVLTHAAAAPWVILAAFVLEPLILGAAIAVLVVWRPAGMAYTLMLIILFVLLYAAGWVGDIARSRLHSD
ncbi:MAG: hypothetical protein M0Z85_08460 [Gammaproteobacteria bacterium]|nr:hypothetical protein [Gammaproteobacteria bacterium]